MKPPGFWLAASFLVAISITVNSCALFHSYGGYAGVTYVAPIGSPPADAILWSPKDSSKILVNSKGLMYSAADIQIITIATGNAVSLAHTDFGAIRGSSWSPDGKYITLSVWGGTKGYPKPGLWILNAEDRSTRFLTARTGEALWLPDGKRLAFFGVDFASAEHPRRLAIYLIDADTGRESLTYSNEDAVAFNGASASPDGTVLAFGLNTSNNISDVFTLDLDTGKVTQLTQSGASARPAWSPTGNVIAYDAGRNQAGQGGHWLHLINPHGSCDTELPEFSSAFSPTWSPDGRQLAFIGPDGIYTVDLATLLGRDINGGLCSAN